MSVALSRPVRWRRIVALLCVAATIVAMCFWLSLDVLGLFTRDTVSALGTVFGRMWPPRLDHATLANAAAGTLQTLSMSIIGTLIGSSVGLVLMPFCCETLFARGPLVDEEERSRGRRISSAVLHHGARLVANVLRTVPYFVWAVLFWFMVGPGTFPGALAIAVHTGGVIARNYAQALDHLDPRPLLALRSGGARRTHVFLFAMLPAARAALASFTLYRWEVNIRELTVLGLVGAGGLGFHLFYAIGIFDWRAAGTHLGAIMALVLAVDAFSAFVRRRLA